MIRSIRLRLLSRTPSPIFLTLPPTPYRSIPSRFSSSTSTAAAPDPDVEDELDESIEPELFGNAYGAGPSRIPYDPNKFTSPKLSPAEVYALERARLAFQLDVVDGRSIYALLKDVDCTKRIAKLGRIEHTAVLQQLLSCGSYNAAAHYMLRAIESLPGDESTRFSVESSTVDSLFLGLLGDNPFPKKGDRLARILLPLLSHLQRMRVRRSERVYQAVIDRLCALGMYDTAAKVYVELVEEWVMEGRIAEGADPDEFYEGGGPPREGRAELELRSSMYKTWWKGIRTWVLPGEVLSPHDRLDLWHPRKQRIPERLRRFPMPMPTSPPTIAPMPTVRHLMTILDSVEIDPDTAKPEAFERSMQACAILASTILSRTIPYLPARLLREVLGRTHWHPPVFPDNLKIDKRGKDSWAYTAHTHIHLAIRSVLLSPPSGPRMFRYMIAFDKAKTEGTPLPQLPENYRYRTAPLNLASCIYLIHYGLRRMRNVHAIRNIMSYVRHSYAAKSLTGLYNVALRDLTQLRSFFWARQADDVMFGHTQLALDAPPLSPVRPGMRFTGARVPVKPEELEPWENSTAAQWSIQAPATGEIQADIGSYEALFRHLVVTNQSDRFIDAVYKLVPFLQYPLDKTTEEYRQTGLLPDNPNSRLRPNHLTPGMYDVILEGLVHFRAIDLGRRIYKLAIQAEISWHKDFPAIGSVPFSHRLSAHLFRSMIILWRMEAQSDQRLQTPYRTAWIAPQGMENKTPREAAQAMVFYVYHQARKRWRNYTYDEDLKIFLKNRAGPSAPTATLFNEIIFARAELWGLRQDKSWANGLTTVARGVEWPRKIAPEPVKEMRMIVGDMREYGFDIPLALRIRLGEEKPMEVAEVVGKNPKFLQELVFLKTRRVKDDDDLIVVEASPGVEVELESFPVDWLYSGEGGQKTTEAV